MRGSGDEVNAKKVIAPIAIGLVLGIVTACSSTSTKTVPGPTVTTTQQVPGPTVTVTQTVSAPPPPAGTKIGTWSGTGNENTPAFNAPDSGNYIVSWKYWNNTDPSIGGASNFSIEATAQNAFGGSLPNDIATSGSGSTQITGTSGVQSFNVQATGSWTITVKSAP
jgi:hypothetical protein